jgi:hypothetical protein
MRPLPGAVDIELGWDPDIDSRDIGVAVKNAVVTLTGFVKSYSEKFEAEAAAKRVAGVVGLANDLEVRLPGAASGRIPISPVTLSQQSRRGGRLAGSISASSSRTDG